MANTKEYMAEINIIDNLLKQAATLIENETKRKAENGEDQHYYYPNTSIYVTNVHVADIYDFSSIQEEQILRQKTHEALNNARFDVKEIPRYLFFYIKGKWFGLFVYSNYRKDTVKRESLFSFEDIQAQCNPYEEKWETTVDEMAKRMENISDDYLGRCIVSDLLEKTKDWNNSHHYALFGKRVIDAIESWLINPANIQFKESRCFLPMELEDQLFRAILGPCETKTLFRYVRNSTLRRIMESGSHAMSSIVCMNDKSECSYASDYVFNQEEIKTVTDIQLDSLYSFNDYITSFSKCQPEELLMWRLYGEDGAGVALEYDVSRIENDSPDLPAGFYLAPVSYAQNDGKHHELDYVKEVLNAGRFDHRELILRRWFLWQRFFKPYNFKEEKEVRLLYTEYEKTTNNTSWVFANGIYSPILKFSLTDINQKYPLTVNRIVLGPRFPEPKVNSVLIERRMKEQGLCIKVDTSEINYYRVYNSSN